MAENATLMTSGGESTHLLAIVLLMCKTPEGITSSCISHVYTACIYDININADYKKIKIFYIFVCNTLVSRLSAHFGSRTNDMCGRISETPYYTWYQGGSHIKRADRETTDMLLKTG